MNVKLVFIALIAFVAFANSYSQSKEIDEEKVYCHLPACLKITSNIYFCF